jgi:NAD-dependent SIR2 family protein deacetylase
LIIIGTSLKVKPFGYLPLGVPPHTPHVLINKDNSDVSGGKKYNSNGVDGKLLLRGDCDRVVKRIVRECGWNS